MLDKDWSRWKYSQQLVNVLFHYQSAAQVGHYLLRSFKPKLYVQQYKYMYN